MRVQVRIKFPQGEMLFRGKDLISSSNSENLLDAQLSVTPGICEQYANIKLYDREGVLRRLALTQELTADYAVSIEAVDDSTDRVVVLGSYIIAEWQIEGNSSEIEVNGRDGSYLFDKIAVTRSIVQTRTVHDFLSEAFALVPGASWRYQDESTRTRCLSMSVPDGWYEEGDFYKMLNKICYLGMLRIYWFIDAFVVGRCI